MFEDTSAREREARQRAIDGFAEAQADFAKLNQVLRREFEAAAGAAASGVMPTHRVAAARQTIETAMNHLAVGISRYDATYELDCKHTGFISRIVAFDAGAGSNGSPTLQPKALVLIMGCSSVTFGQCEMSSEYTRHALVRWLERTQYDTIDFLGDLVEAELMTLAMIGALGDGRTHDVICPMGGGALLGTAQPYPFKNPIAGVCETVSVKGRRESKIRIRPDEGPRHATPPTRVIWKTFIGEDELRPRQVAVLEAIERTIQPVRKALRISQSMRLDAGTPGRSEDERYLADNKTALNAQLTILKEVLMKRAWLLPELKAA